MKTSTMNRVGRPPRKTLCVVQIRLCSSHCKLCKTEHWSEPLDARRVDQFYVRISQLHPVWHGALLAKSEYRFVE